MAERDWSVDEDLRRQVVAQLSACAHMAAYIALVHRDLARIWAAAPLSSTLHVTGEFSAGRMEILGDLLNNMDACAEEDAWIDPIFAEAHRRWPQEDPADQYDAKLAEAEEKGRQAGLRQAAEYVKAQDLGWLNDTIQCMADEILALPDPDPLSQSAQEGVGDALFVDPICHIGNRT